MNSEDIATVLIYVAAFGFSDLFVEKYNLGESQKLLYYGFALVVGVLMFERCYEKKRKKKNV